MRIHLITLLGFLSSSLLISQNLITITKFVGGVSIPVDIANCGDDRLFVVEKTGKIRVIENGVVLPVAFLDIINKVRSTGGEQGLLGLAFHPDYLNNGYFYVNYTDKASPTKTVIERYKVTANKNKADSTSGQIILSFVQPYANHNGGGLVFGPDGYLYIGTGDGGSGNDPDNNGQKKNTMLGKMLRIDVDTTVGYKIPPTNPFINDASYFPEIWSLGLRNPWRYSFDRVTGDLWIGDVGQALWEELDFEASNSPGGMNYGWRCYEGNHDFNLNGCGPKNNYTFPLHEYASDQNTLGCSITGGYVYRGDKYPSLYGKYIYGDYCSGKIWLLNKLGPTMYTNVQGYDYSNNALTTFGEDRAGNIYFADVQTSSIYKISDTCKFNFNVIVSDVSCSGKDDGSARTDLNNTNNTRYQWSTGDTTAQVDNLSPGLYSVKVTYNQCLTEVQFEIKEKASDTACISSPAQIEICEGDTALISACDQQHVISYQWYKDSVLVINGNERQLLVSEAGVYQLRFTDTSGCISALSSPVQLIIHTAPDQPTIHLEGYNGLIADTGFVLYKWYLDGLFIDETQENKFNAHLEGDYQVIVIDSNGCVSVFSDTFTYIRTNTTEISSVDKTFSLRPNPVSDVLILETVKNIIISKLDYQIISTEKKEIMKGRISNFRDASRIDVSQLSPGMYWIRFKYNNSEEKLGFIKGK